MNEMSTAHSRQTVEMFRCRDGRRLSSGSPPVGKRERAGSGESFQALRLRTSAVLRSPPGWGVSPAGAPSNQITVIRQLVDTPITQYCGRFRAERQVRDSRAAAARRQLQRRSLVIKRLRAQLCLGSVTPSGCQVLAAVARGLGSAPFPTINFTRSERGGKAGAGGVSGNAQWHRFIPCRRRADRPHESRVSNRALTHGLSELSKTVRAAIWRVLRQRRRPTTGSAIAGSHYLRLE